MEENKFDILKFYENYQPRKSEMILYGSKEFFENLEEAIKLAYENQQNGLHENSADSKKDSNKDT